MPLQFRRGTDAQRLTITPASGEPLWTTNTNRLYVGDGTTVGGVAVEIPLPSTGTFTSLTVTNIHFTGDPVGVDQTTAWTGTVAWSAISSKPNGGLYTTSTVEFNQLSVTGSAVASTQSSVLINASGSTTYEPPHSTGYLLWGINKSTSTSARIVTDAYGGNNTASSVWTGRKARGSASAPTAVQNGDLILRIAGTGFGTTEFENTSSAYLEVVALENMTDGAHGTKFNFVTTNVGSNSQSTALVVQSSGTVVTAPTVPATGSALTINQTGGASYPAPPNSGQLVWGISNDATAARMVIDNYSTSPFPSFLGRAGRGTAAAPTAVQADDTLLSVRANGYGTTGFKTTASGFINFSAIENFTDTVRGTRMQIYATAPGDTFASLVSTHRADGTFIYSTATTANANAQLVVQGSYPNLTFQSAEAGTNIMAVNTPGYSGRIVVDTYADDLPDNVDKSYLTGRRARGTAQAPTQMLSGDSMLRVAGYAYGTTKFISTASAGINFNVTENVTDNAAGGSITFDVLPAGVAPIVANQQVVATMDQTGLTINNGGLTATIATLDTAKVDDLYSKTLAGTITVHNPMAPTGTVNLGSSGNPWANIYGSTIVPTTLDFTGDPVGVVQTTAWTGTVANSQITSVSTSKVTGLSIVGWTNKYSDLTGKPNQDLNTTDAVQFAGITDTGPLSVTGFSSLNGGATISAATVTNNLSAGATTLQSVTVTTGTQLTKTLSVGGYALNSAGTSSWATNSVFSPTLIVTNTTPGQNPVINVRGFGQNNPNGGAATVPNPALRLETALGTNASPTAVTANSNLGGFIVGGYDGRNWPSDYSMANNFLGFYATENMTNDGSTSTYQAGSGFNIYTQPQWTRPGLNATRQRFIITNWTTASTGPSVNNIVIGSGVDGTAPTMTMVDGTTYTGYGRGNTTFMNSYLNLVGVAGQDTAPDNATLTGTNILTIVGNRRSGVLNRRNPIVAGDQLGGIYFNGQSATSTSGVGVQGAYFSVNALDNFSGGTTRGTAINIATANTGTSQAPSTRLYLSDRSNNYTSDQHLFRDKTGSFTALTLTTSSAVFGAGITVGNPGVTFPLDGQIQNVAWQPAYLSAYDTTNQTTSTTTGLNIVQIGSITTASGVTLLSNGAQVTNAGVYNIQQSIQFVNSSAGAEDVVVWLRQNSTDLSNSAGVLSVPGQHGGADGKAIASWNYVVTAAANDVFYLMWQPQSTNISIATTTVGTGTPQSPGVILSVVRER